VWHAYTAVEPRGSKTSPEIIGDSFPFASFCGSHHVVVYKPCTVFATLETTVISAETIIVQIDDITTRSFRFCIIFFWMSKLYENNGHRHSFSLCQTRSNPWTLLASLSLSECECVCMCVHIMYIYNIVLCIVTKTTKRVARLQSVTKK